MKQPFQALYIHIPFCVKRCAYCDFPTNALPYSSPIIDSYIDQLITSIELASRANLLNSVRTIYIGGGTPSYIGVSRMCRLLDVLEANVDFAQVCEFTMEANPDSFSENIASCITKRGVNRFSIGVQSTDNNVLHLLGRVHNASQALDALSIACSYTSNVSADIICGVMDAANRKCRTPNFSSTLKSLQDVVSIGANHISVYPLTIEEDTPLEHLISTGSLLDIDEDKQADEMLMACEFLTSQKPQSFGRYEVSNYALSGCASQHNMGYWTGVPYLGLGYGASSMFDLTDFNEVCASATLQVWGMYEDQDGSGAQAHVSLRASRDDNYGANDYNYSEGRIRITAGAMHDICSNNSQCNKCFIEKLTPKQSAAEDFMLKMRMTKGISSSQLRILQNVNPALVEAEQTILNKGLAKWNEDDEGDGDKISCDIAKYGNAYETSSKRLVPTQTGWLDGNELFGAIWNTGT